MKRSWMRLRLRPIEENGAYTWISLSGPVPTVTRHQETRRLITILAMWSGAPMRVALSAGDPAGWAEIWTDNLCAVPERHLEVHIRIPRRGDREHTRHNAVDDRQLSLLELIR
jgi:hypothetical protein